MRIEIKNPRVVIIGNKMIVKEIADAEQIARTIEKYLLSRSIICDEIKVIGEKE